MYLKRVGKSSEFLYADRMTLSELRPRKKGSSEMAHLQIVTGTP